MSLSKIWIPVAALSMMFLMPAAAVEPTAAEHQQMAEPRSMSFQIPMNNYCSLENPQDFSFQLSNASDSAANITVRFFQQDGTEFKEEGTAYREMKSDIVPGKPTSLQAHATGVYHINFGNHKQCNERVYLGEIKVNSGQASLLATGWVNTAGTYEKIVVNDNRKFDLSAPVSTAGTSSP
ncbi:hypothetical protein GCM10023310_34660 [Paenibacillus vulneris]|uniref:Uncharacterized protein n=1 Tax=Paenibacillus vulneris TaxID=1133364 RepID=A0ABW3UU47_9BACL|nr:MULTISPECIES: hypothetical protein [unclassified Paenibacillus]MBE1443020.1 hypothetical protein [Paenibacillus sp. OAS669]